MEPLQPTGRAMRAPWLVVAYLLLSISTSPATAACVENPNDPLGDGEPLSAYLGPCKKCADSDSCAECWPEFGVASNGSCVQCPFHTVGRDSEGRNITAYCATCDGDEPTFCYECFDPYSDFDVGLYATEDGQCQLCYAGCAACNSTAACTECLDGFGLVDGACRACQDDRALRCDGDTARATRCRDGWSPDPQAGGCFQCPANCSECSSPTKCTLCGSDTGLDPDSGACVDEEGCRVANCWDCRSSLDVCSDCAVGYVAVDGRCVKCPEGCDSCDTPTACRRCSNSSDGGAPPLGVGPDGRCVPCTDPNCALCGEDAGRCAACKEGTRLEWGAAACLPCTPPCTSCDTGSLQGDEVCYSE